MTPENSRISIVAAPFLDRGMNRAAAGAAECGIKQLDQSPSYLHDLSGICGYFDVTQSELVICAVSTCVKVVQFGSDCG
jgi:hypothetical protein